MNWRFHHTGVELRSCGRQHSSGQFYSNDKFFVVQSFLTMPLFWVLCGLSPSFKWSIFHTVLLIAVILTGKCHRCQAGDRMTSFSLCWGIVLLTVCYLSEKLPATWFVCLPGVCQASPPGTVPVDKKHGRLSSSRIPRPSSGGIPKTNVKFFWIWNTVKHIIALRFAGIRSFQRVNLLYIFYFCILKSNWLLKLMEPIISGDINSKKSKPQWLRWDVIKVVEWMWAFSSCWVGHGNRNKLSLYTIIMRSWMSAQSRKWPQDNNSHNKLNKGRGSTHVSWNLLQCYRPGAIEVYWIYIYCEYKASAHKCTDKT